MRGVSKHEGALVDSSSSFETRARAFTLAVRSRMRAPQDEDEHRECTGYLSKRTSSFPRRVFAPRFLHRCFAHPNRGWAERRETFGCSGTRWGVPHASKTRVNALMTPHARRLARRLASHDVGRSPLGAPPWRFWAPGPRFSHRHLRRIGHSELLARDFPSLPGRAVTSRRRRTPRLAPHSGSSREHALNEQGCECLS